MEKKKKIERFVCKFDNNDCVLISRLLWTTLVVIAALFPSIWRAVSSRSVALVNFMHEQKVCSRVLLLHTQSFLIGVIFV